MRGTSGRLFKFLMMTRTRVVAAGTEGGRRVSVVFWRQSLSTF